MTKKTVLHFEVTANLFDGGPISGFSRADCSSNLADDSVISILLGSPDSGEFIQIRSGDISTLKIKAVFEEEPKEPAQ